MNDASTLWTASRRARWERILAHPIGGADAEAEFVARLAREQAWSARRARDAMLEYRRFAFLAGVAGHEVTPSHAVDAVWHLHLLFTRDYWDVFCPAALGAPLHHDPGVSAADAPRHREQYARTVVNYGLWFGPPPRTFWPPPAAVPRAAAAAAAAAAQAAPTSPRLRDLRRLRHLARASGLALLCVPFAALSAERPLNPLEWTGGDFLVLYLWLAVATVIGSLVWRGMLRRLAETPARTLGTLSPWDAAYLAGGPLRVIDAGVAELHEQGVLRWDATQRALVNDDPARRLEPPLDIVARHATTRGPKTAATRTTAAALGGIRHRLQQHGLWLEDAAARRIAGLSAMPALLLCAFAAAKIMIGLDRGKPVAFLVVLGVLTAGFALAMFLARPGRSRAGDRELAKMRVSTRGPQARRPDSLAMAVALGGTAILAGTALSGYHQARAASSAGSDGGSGSDSGGDGGGGSGCGGCGGGD